MGHEGNSQDSEEEADEIDGLLKCERKYGDSNRHISLEDIVIVAPCNLKVRILRKALPGVKVGTLNKFQGQEAPIVIVSMCSSTEDSSAREILSLTRID